MSGLNQSGVIFHVNSRGQGRDEKGIRKRADRLSALRGRRQVVSYGWRLQHFLVEDRVGVGFLDELGVEVEEEVEAAVGFRVVNLAGHEDVGGVVVAFGFDEGAVELGEFGVGLGEGGGEELEFFAASAFDEGAADEVVDGLVA